MYKNSFFALMALVFAGLFFSSCNKSNQNYDTSFSEDYAYAENTFSDVDDIADEGYERGSTGHKSGSGTGVILSDCADVSIDFSKEPYELIIDFGEENCLCNDDKYRRGKIKVTFDGAYREEGTLVKHYLEDYYVDDDRVDGTRTVVNKGRNDADRIWFEVVETGLITKDNDGGTITWNSDRQRVWIAGDSTLNVSDDTYLISGTSRGTTTTNESWEMETIQPLLVELDCRWIPSGILEINIQDIPTATLNYGNGDCDREATLEINGKTYTIYMK
jgi:hypothetical protein